METLRSTEEGVKKETAEIEGEDASSETEAPLNSKHPSNEPVEGVPVIETTLRSTEKGVKKETTEIEWEAASSETEAPLDSKHPSDEPVEGVPVIEMTLRSIETENRPGPSRVRRWRMLQLKKLQGAKSVRMRWRRLQRNRNWKRLRVEEAEGEPDGSSETMRVKRRKPEGAE